MYKILEAKELTANIYLMVVEAPRVAKNCQPGQFVILRVDEKGERIPLTVADFDREKALHDYICNVCVYDSYIAESPCG